MLIIEVLIYLAAVFLLTAFGALLFIVLTNPYRDKLLKRLDTMLCEKDGFWSSTRFRFLFEMFIANASFWGLVIYLTIKNSKFPNIPESILIAYGGIQIISAVLKFKQKTVETEEPAEEK